MKQPFFYDSHFSLNAVCKDKPEVVTLQSSLEPTTRVKSLLPLSAKILVLITGDYS